MQEASTSGRNLSFNKLKRLFIFVAAIFLTLRASDGHCLELKPTIKLLINDDLVAESNKQLITTNDETINHDSTKPQHFRMYQTELRGLSYETIHRILRDENEPVYRRDASDLRYFQKQSHRAQHEIIRRSPAQLDLALHVVNMSNSGLTKFSAVEDLKNFTGQLDDIFELILSRNALRSFKVEGLTNLHNLDLSRNQLREIPLEKNSTVRFLNLNQNYIVKYSSSDSPNKNLRQLHLSCNGIFNLGLLNLWKFEEVEVLDLSFNFIKSIEGSLFSLRMKNLKYLNLAANRLSTIYRETFYNMLSLNTLVLTENNITEIDYETFLALPNLQYLDLSNNQLRGESIRALQGIPDLVGLSIAFNLDLGGSVQEFVASWSLKELDASGTGLCQIPAALVQSVRTLKLVNNWLKVINCGDLDSYPLLQYLDLSFSHINDVEDDAFGRLEVLEALFLDHNSLQKVPVSLPTSLQYLFLHNNRIEEIQPQVFQGLSQLRTLDMSRNQLLYLPALPLPKLITINIQGSGITGVSQRLIRTSPKLRDLLLEDNPIKCSDLLGITEWASSCRIPNNEGIRQFNQHVNIKSKYQQTHNYARKFKEIHEKGENCSCRSTKRDLISILPQCVIELEPDQKTNNASKKIVPETEKSLGRKTYEKKQLIENMDDTESAKYRSTPQEKPEMKKDKVFSDSETIQKSFTSSTMASALTFFDDVTENLTVSTPETTAATPNKFHNINFTSVALPFYTTAINLIKISPADAKFPEKASLSSFYNSSTKNSSKEIGNKIRSHINLYDRFGYAVVASILSPMTSNDTRIERSNLLSKKRLKTPSDNESASGSKFYEEYGYERKQDLIGPSGQQSSLAVDQKLKPTLALQDIDEGKKSSRKFQSHSEEQNAHINLILTSVPIHDRHILGSEWEQYQETASEKNGTNLLALNQKIFRPNELLISKKTKHVIQSFLTQKEVEQVHPTSFTESNQKDVFRKISTDNWKVSNFNSSQTKPILRNYNRANDRMLLSEQQKVVVASTLNEDKAFVAFTKNNDRYSSAFGNSTTKALPKLNNAFHPIKISSSSPNDKNDEKLVTTSKKTKSGMFHSKRNHESLILHTSSIDKEQRELMKGKKLFVNSRQAMTGDKSITNFSISTARENETEDAFTTGYKEPWTSIKTVKGVVRGVNEDYSHGVNSTVKALTIETDHSNYSTASTQVIASASAQIHNLNEYGMKDNLTLKSTNSERWLELRTGPTTSHAGLVVVITLMMAAVSIVGLFQIYRCHKPIRRYDNRLHYLSKHRCNHAGEGSFLTYNNHGGHHTQYEIQSNRLLSKAPSTKFLQSNYSPLHILKIHELETVKESVPILEKISVKRSHSCSSPSTAYFSQTNAVSHSDDVEYGQKLCSIRITDTNLQKDAYYIDITEEYKQQKDFFPMEFLNKTTTSPESASISIYRNDSSRQVPHIDGDRNSYFNASIMKKCSLWKAGSEQPLPKLQSKSFGLW